MSGRPTPAVSIPAQEAIAQYHREISQHAAHGGHDMYLFHRDWHSQNRDPVPPQRPNRAWGTNLVYGTNFLQMHHEMVKASDNERKYHMQHQSLAAWYSSKGYPLPPEWDPLAEIPALLSYTPNLSIFPAEIQDAVRGWASDENLTPEQLLTRRTNRPRFTLPRWFTRQGVARNERGEPYTGARKLADFRNTNQLGCCIVFPHNSWHGSIGGAMGTTWTAIADPIFYFGVHRHLDKVFDEYKLILAEREIRALDPAALETAGALESEGLEPPSDFTQEEKAQRERDIEVSRSLNRNLW
jgi:hypothetical protein